MARIFVATCLTMTACLLACARQERSDQANTQEKTLSKVSPSPADSQPQSISSPQPTRAPLFFDLDHPVKAPTPDIGMATIRVEPELSDKFVKQELSSFDAKIPADPETLKKAIEEEISKSAKADGKTIEEFLKKVDGTAVASKIDQLAEDATKQLEAEGSRATFKKQLDACYEKEASEIVGIAKDGFSSKIVITGAYYLDKKKWTCVGEFILLFGVLSRPVPTKIKLASTVDLSESVGRKLLVPMSETIDLAVELSPSVAGDSDADG